MAESEPDLTTPEELQLQQLLEHDGTRYVDDYQPMRDGTSWGSRCPQPLARMLGFPTADRIKTWVNVEQNMVVHQVVTDQEGDDG